MQIDRVVYQKGAIYRTEIERPFSAATSFNTNLVQFLPPYHVIISNVHVRPFTWTISHVQDGFAYTKNGLYRTPVVAAFDFLKSTCHPMATRTNLTDEIRSYDHRAVTMSRFSNPVGIYMFKVK